MSSVPSAAPPGLQELIAGGSRVWAVLIGLAVLLVPTYLRLSFGVWQEDEQAHGPIILAISLWLAWQCLGKIGSGEHRSAPIGGGILLGLGLALYVIGRSQEILFLEVGAQLPVLAGTALLLGGMRYLRSLWFPIMFLAFMVPLPGFLVDALTGPLKQHVSALAAQILYAAGYPIARHGVVLVVGQYQLLVADACSGLNSMYSLSALGLLYMYLMKHPQWWRNAILLMSIPFIAFAANTIRVLVLVLVTYHLGDEAGQGFVHGLAGMVLFIVALLLLFLIDSVLGLTARLFRRRFAP